MKATFLLILKNQENHNLIENLRILINCGTPNKNPNQN